MLKFRKNYLENTNACKFLSDIGFNEDEIVRILSDSSLFVTYYDKIDVMFKRGYDYLINKKFTVEQIRKMILRYPGVLTFSDEKKNKVEEYFKELLIVGADFRRIVLKCPNVYGYTLERTKGYVDYFKEIGYKDENDIKYILKNCDSLFNRSVSTLKILVNDMKMCGFSIDNILVIGKNYPLFWVKSFDKVKSVVECLIKLDFTKEGAINVVVNASSLIGYDTDTINNKFMDIVALGFDNEEVVSMISVFPALIVSDINRTRSIVNFFTCIGLRDKIVINPKSFFKQSIEASYARYMFYKEENVEINSDTYKRLFYRIGKFSMSKLKKQTNVYNCIDIHVYV